MVSKLIVAAIAGTALAVPYYGYYPAYPAYNYAVQPYQRLALTPEEAWRSEAIKDLIDAMTRIEADTAKVGATLTKWDGDIAESRC
jgi:hypothetical protein